MRIVVFGLTVSSSWGNGHALLWRGLLRALDDAGHRVTFVERDVPYYAAHRDLHALPGDGQLVFHDDWSHERARALVRDADVAVVTSYCPDAIAAGRAIADARPPLSCFYDLDSPVTLERHRAGDTVEYLGPDGYRSFDLVLSYAGGPMLAALRDELGARLVRPLYGSVDPDTHRPGAPAPQYVSDLSYLGTYAADRQAALARLLLEPARACPARTFLIAGAQYPSDFPWAPNLRFVRHLPSGEHAAFYAGSRLTLNITRAAMLRSGWCPSGRLFEAAACGAPLLTDRWPGLDHFFTPGEEILLADGAADALRAIDTDDGTLRRIAARARARTLDENSATRRAAEMIAAFEAAAGSGPARATADAAAPAPDAAPAAAAG